MDVICFGQTDWDFCWTGKQHLMSRLATRGHRVLYVDPHWRVLPRAGLDAVRALAPLTSGLGLREVAPQLYVHTPTPSPLLPWRLEQRRVPGRLRALARRLGMRAPAVLTLVPRARRLAAALPAGARLHYAIDEMTGFGGLDEASRRRVRREEEASVRESDVVLAISPRLRARLALLHERVYLLPSGAEVEHFAAAADPRGPRHPVLEGTVGPVLGFVGQVDERLDQDLLVHLARVRPGWTVVLAGRVKEGVDLTRLRALPNLRLVGYLPYVELPDLLRGVDVAIVPYRDAPLTRACSPLKVYEYLAANRPVVSTPLEGLGACAEVVRVASGPSAFLAAVEACLARPEEGRAARRAVAEASRWEHRVDELERRIAEAFQVARRRGDRPAAAA